MDCTSNGTGSAKELHCEDDKAVTITSNNVVAMKDNEVDKQVNNNPTTSGTSTTNVKQEQVGGGEEEKYIENVNNENNEDLEDGDKTSSPMMMIAKGKRTKRQRTHSPIIGEHKCANNQEDVQVVMDEDEEVEMANCLILLAQGQAKPPAIRRNELGLFTSSDGSTMRFSSDNKRPSYNNSSVYECKTCSRTFSSFQALGGHRASHKKLKVTTTTTTNNNNSFSQMVTLASSSSALSLQLGNINYIRSTTPTPTYIGSQNNSSNKNRIHECAICGAEFSSGQALGGHMRRHRGPVMPLNSSTTTTNKLPFSNTTLSLSTNANAVAATVESKVDKSDGFLSLDLNMPASHSPLLPPTEDDTKLSNQQKQLQSSSGMVLSTSAFVGCFY